jgi:Protein of unknown function (DUF4058)
MPLRDHFRPPVSNRHHWPAIHARGATAISDDLNRRLPDRFVAEAPYHLGTFVSADVAEYERDEAVANFEGSGNGGIATAVQTYAPPAAPVTLAAAFAPVFRVEVFDLERSRSLLAVVELASPANQDRPSSRESFAAKCTSCLLAGVGLVLVDIVTNKQFNLHNEMMRLGEHPSSAHLPTSCATYAAAYRPTNRDGQDAIDCWPIPLTVGGDLPTVPLALLGYGCIVLNLEETYEEACERCRIE